MCLTLVLNTYSTPAHAAANTGRQFLTSVVYGTLAGTLVGAATLAFTSSPADNLNNVARGASYGLYTGILLGIWVAYLLPDPKDPYSQQYQYQAPPPPPPPPADGPQSQFRSNKIEDLGRVAVYPLLPAPDAPGRWGVGMTINAF